MRDVHERHSHVKDYIKVTLIEANEILSSFDVGLCQYAKNRLTKVKGMAFNKGISLSPPVERDDVDELRMAVKEVLCDSGKERQQYEEALVAITVEESLKCYCQHIQRPDFWGGESELLVLSRLCDQPIVVYIPEHENMDLNSAKGPEKENPGKL
ncbi:hypothetical protein REPUB_Repub04eG0173200 [Reevesia pubescens]